MINYTRKTSFSMILILITVVFLTSCIPHDKAAKRDVDIIRQNIQQINEENAPQPISYPVPSHHHTNQHVLVTLLEKGSIKSDNEKFYDYIPIKVKVNNVTRKDLENIKAKVYFKDRNNNMIGYTTIQVNQVIPSGGSIEHSERYIMSSKAEHKNFIDAKASDIAADATAFSYKHLYEDPQEIRVW